AGRAEVDVRVEEGREHVLSGPVDRLAVLRPGERARGTELGDSTVADQHVVGLVQAGPRVEHVRAADQQRGRPEGRCHERAAHAGALAGAGSATGAWAPAESAGVSASGAPATSSNRTAMRTTMPASTWAVMTACGPSITSAASSTPRFTGPGCMSTWPGRRRPESIW